MLWGRSENDTFAESVPAPSNRDRGNREVVEDDVVPAHLGVQEVGPADEARHEARARPSVEGARRVDLLDPSLVHHGDPVGRHHRLRLVVRDVHGGHAELVVEPPDLVAHLLAQVCVQVGQRLVEEQHGGLHHDGPGQRHALLLAARELLGIAAGEVLHLHDVQDVARPWNECPLASRRRTSRPKATFSATVMFGQMA